MSTPSDWESEVRQYRADKDEYFGRNPQSPLPPDQRETFDGLRYYPPDPTYRVEATLSEHDERETITVATTTEGEREYIDWGEFRFELDGEPCTLHAYRRDPDEGGFWLPFRDATSGDETYGAGRYLDIDAADRTEDGEWVLDFNLAYNPFCVYSPAYECPLVPGENWLDVPVKAGEKNYQPE